MKRFVSLLVMLLAGCFTGDAAKHLYCREDASCGPGQTCLFEPGQEWGQCDGPDPHAGTETDTDTDGDTDEAPMREPPSTSTD